MEGKTVMPDTAGKPTLHDRVLEMAKELKLDGDELDDYVASHMKKGGWKPVTTWSPPDGKTGDGQQAKPGWFKD
jgi:hypothetical protein